MVMTEAQREAICTVRSSVFYGNWSDAVNEFIDADLDLTWIPGDSEQCECKISCLEVVYLGNLLIKEALK
jgi:hypothetical protein